ncbi:MAG: hypothetical protein AMJ46_13510 [Latescibacteria bacterium DG_63]|nr:MAG: hypothetical protein AMJ46_13510 [Latescibacteria bacterium DG_63]
MAPRGMLFDLDDTIVAYDAVAEPTWRSVCDHYSRRFPILDKDVTYDTIKEVRIWYWSDMERHKSGRRNLDEARRRIVRLALAQLGVNDVGLADGIADMYSVRREEEVHFFLGAENALEYFSSNGISLVLVTNGDAGKQRDKVRRFQLERFFKAVLIEGELGYGKPDEAIYLRALDELSLSPGDVWSIGDNLEWDVRAPQKLGIYSIWNDYRKRGLPPGSTVVPNRIVHSISELIPK